MAKFGKIRQNTGVLDQIKPPDDSPLQAIDRSERQGSALAVLLLALALVGAVFLSSALDEERRTQFILWFVAALAAIGVAAMFLVAIGYLKIAGQGARNDLTKAIADTAADALLVTDSSRRVVYANAAYQKLAGVAGPGGVRTLERLFSGASDVSEAVYRLSQAARDGKRAIEEIRLTPPLTGDTGVGWYRVRVRPVEGVKGSLNLWSVADISRERERHENVFQELQNVVDYLDHAPAGFLSADSKGEIVYLNATLAGWLDYDIAQFGTGGLKLGEIIQGDGAALLGVVGGHPGQVKTEILDLDLKRRNGQTLPARLFHRIAYGNDGVPGASRTLVMNRSQGEDTEEDRRAAEVRFARFFNNAPLSIITARADGAISQTNAPFARVFAEFLKAPRGPGERNILDAVAGEDRAQLKSALEDAASRKSDIKPLELLLAGTEGRSARFFVSGVDQGAADGEAAVIYALDTTEQKTLQEQFTQAQKMQAVGQLAGGVAHDFNNVLTAIIGYSDLLLANHRPTDPSFQDIMQIKQNANRAASLVRQLLAFSRRQTMRPQTLYFNDTLSDFAMLLRRLLGEKVELEYKHGRDLWPVMADINQFEQVVMNLAVNARDAMPDGGKVVISTRNIPAADIAGFNYSLLPPGDQVLIEVSDTGTGVAPNIRDKIFEPFFTTKEVGKGTGLGLSMVYGIVKQSNGFIFCESEPGKGTTFRIFLPRHTPAAEEKTPEKDSKPGTPRDLTGQGTILLVEDEEAVRAFAARALRSRGYTVLEAGSGVEALDVLEGHHGPLNLVVSDVVMPEMDGPTMLVELRKRLPDVKVIFISGYAEEAFRKNLPDGLEFGFLPKPFTLKQLVEAVKEHAA